MKTRRPMHHFSTFTSSPIPRFTWNRYWKNSRFGFGQTSAIRLKATMDSRDTAPDSWEQEDDVEATADTELQSAFTGLNVNAAEFVPSFLSRDPPENATSDGKLSTLINRLTALIGLLIKGLLAGNVYSRLAGEMVVVSWALCLS